MYRTCVLFLLFLKVFYEVWCGGLLLLSPSDNTTKHGKYEYWGSILVCSSFFFKEKNWNLHMHVYICSSHAQYSQSSYGILPFMVWYWKHKTSIWFSCPNQAQQRTRIRQFFVLFHLAMYVFGFCLKHVRKDPHVHDWTDRVNPHLVVWVANGTIPCHGFDLWSSRKSPYEKLAHFHCLSTNRES